MQYSTLEEAGALKPLQQDAVPHEVLDKFWGSEAHVLAEVETADSATLRARCDRRCCRRTLRVARLGFLRGCCCTRDGAIFASAIVTGVLAVVTTTAFFFLYSPLVSALEDNSVSAFYKGILNMLLVMLANMLISGLAMYLGQFMAIRMRQSITRVLHFRYLSDNTYYRMLNMDKRVDNPDQRLVEDVRLFCDSFMALAAGTPQFSGGLIGATLSALILGYMAWTAIGAVAWFSSLAFVVAGFVATKLFLNRVVPLVFRQDRLEGDFRFAHIHLREHAESVAFYAGEDQQHVSLNVSLRRALVNFFKLTKARLPLNAATQVVLAFSRLLAVIVPAVVIAVMGQLASGTFTQGYSYLMGFLVGLSGLLNTVGYVTSLAGYGNRVGEMLEILDDIEAQQRAHVFQVPSSTEITTAGTFRPADQIALRCVTCRTPDNLVLARNVSLSLEKGESLLIMGPSGVGKSSLLRVLGALWPISPGGVVSRPGHVGRGGLFYLPQDAYLVHEGTLRAQLVYPLAPHEERGRISTDEMQTLLAGFALEHLMRYADAPEGEVDWDTVLSGGEKQRLSMARLFFHRPNFAILDECTSAVDEEMEDRFFARMRDSGMGYISVAHSSRVKRYHGRVLVLDPHGGYELVDTQDVPDRIQWTEKFATQATLNDEDSEVSDSEISLPSVLSPTASQRENTVFRPVTEAAAVVQDATPLVFGEARKLSEATIPPEELAPFWPEQTKAHRSEILARVSGTDQAQERAALNLRFLSRVTRLRRIVFRGCCSRVVRLWWAAALFAWIKAATVVAVPILTTRVMETVLTEGAREQAAQWIALLVASLATQALCVGLFLFFSGWLVKDMRERVTRYVHHRYLNALAYYKLCCNDTRVDNPDQRIAQDARDLCASAALLMFGDLPMPGVVELVPELVALSVISYLTITWRGIALAFGLALASFVANRFLASPLVPLVFRQDRLEGDFRFSHARLRTHAESITFLAGGSNEHHRANSYLARALANKRVLILRQMFLNMFFVFTNTLPTGGGIFLGGMIYFYGGGAGGMDLVAFFFGVYAQFSALFYVFANIFKLVEPLATFAGHANRLGDFLEILDDVQASSWQLTYRDSSDISLQHVSVAAPDGKRLAQDLSLRVQAGESLLLMGPSGVGKTSVLRTMAGLWPPASGEVLRPRKVGRDGIFFLPQSALLILGTLKEQVVYPSTAGDAALSDDGLRALLREVRLEHLLDRVYGTPATAASQAHQAHWGDLLSGGERQRLAMARLFFHRPQFAILDECTSAVDEEMEQVFYDKLRAMGIGFVSVAHRSTVRRHHQRGLTLARDGSWAEAAIAGV